MQTTTEPNRLSALTAGIDCPACRERLVLVIQAGQLPRLVEAWAPGGLPVGWLDVNPPTEMLLRVEDENG
jgi:hypothetical protein